MSSIYWSYTPKSYAAEFDVLIVGAGYVGLSAAYFLKRDEPSLKIAVIDQDSIGNGASGRNAGFLTKGSLLFYSHLATEWGSPNAISLYHYAQDSINQVVNEFDLLSSGIAIPSSCWTFLRSVDSLKKIPEDILQNYKEAKSPLEIKGTHTYSQHEEYSVNPQRLLSVIEKKVKDLGVEFILGTQVLSVSSETSPVVATSIGQLKCKKLLFCTNAQTELIPELVSLNIIPKRAQMLAVKLEKPIFENGLFYDPEQRVYFKFDKPGHLLIGGKRLVDEVNENTHAQNITDKVQNALMEYVQTELNLRGERITGWAGSMGFTPTEIPFVGEIHNLKSCYAAAGFSGHGMGWGFKTAHEISLTMLGKITHPQLALIKK